jgi:hypothetical protein
MGVGPWEPIVAIAICVHSLTSVKEVTSYAITAGFRFVSIVRVVGLAFR